MPDTSTDITTTNASPDSIKGLTSAEVQDRINSGAVNIDAGVKTRSVKQILFENICTLFNAMNVVLAVFVAITGSFKNMLFMLVIVINTVIGIVQEIRSKRTTDALSIIASSKAEVVRNGKHEEIPIDQIVRDDVIVLGRGDQVPADSIIIYGDCDVNESLLTGESDTIRKKPGDELMSGSFINSGKVYARVEHVGNENYAAQISNEAKARKKVNSEIMRSLNGIIKFVSFVIIPVGLALFGREFLVAHTPWDEAILSTVAALVGMIPEGLILLTSTVLAVAVIRLSQSKVLVQQLYCIETLARVDVLCLDKTGTITTGAMEVAGIEPIDGIPDKASALSEIDSALSSMVACDDDPNETSLAIAKFFETKDAHGPTVCDCERIIPFDSTKKWSGATLANGQSYVMGASQFIMGDGYGKIASQVEQLTAGARVLLVAKVCGFNENGDLTGDPSPLGFVLIHDEIRSTAKQTIAYFKEQGVSVNVISGDDPRTVSGIAAKVGIEGADEYVDATTLKTIDDIREAVQRYHVFGRVKPEQKKQFVLAYQELGHTVAMTGDGVNDTLALKAADCGVAMASGSDAARNVATLVLVNNDFASMPKVVAEGRRSINNLQRSASLFLVKTLLSATLAVLFILLPWQYPFQPIQMTLISAFTIGLPSFVLALEPNHDLVRGRFLRNVIVRSIPSAVCAVLTIVIVNIIGYEWLGFDYEQVSTLCVLLTAWIGFMLVVRLSIPFTPIRAALCIVIIAGLLLGSIFFNWLFAISPFTTDMWIVFAICAVAVTICFQILYTAITGWYDKSELRNQK